uniref:Bbp19-like phage domain-containing protein n=1 Tax=viral metagenome TaxID=1070528 RepID=A0A6H1ZVB1_9ZZZZ
MERFTAPDKAIRLYQAYRDVFSGEAGELVLNDLMERCYMTSSTFVEDALTSAFYQGQRDVGLHILHAVYGQMPEPEKETGGEQYDPLKKGEE